MKERAPHTQPILLLQACLLGGITLLALRSPATASADDLAIVGATIVDVEHGGRSTHDRPDAVILIRSGVIAAVGERGQVEVPPGTRVLDASGTYVVPGLIDGFGALRSQAFADAYLYEGVTTVFVTQSPAGSDGEQVIAATSRGPRLFRGITIGGYSSSGELPTTHPWTDHRLHDQPLSADALRRAIDTAADQGVRGLFLTLDVLPNQLPVILGEARQRHLPTLGEPAFASYSESIAAGVGTFIRSDRYETSLAPAPDRLGYADDPTGKGAVGAIRAVCGVELDSPALAALAGQLAASHSSLMPILSIEATADDLGTANPWSSRSAAFVKPSDLDDPVDPKTGARPYLESHPERRQALQACALHREEIDAALHRHGTTYLAGSGSPAFGIMPGGGLHQELHLLQRIGLTPREVLAAATGNFAEIFGWTDVGRIEVGRAADLLVVGSDPRLEVSALDDIRMVIQNGQLIDRAALLANATQPAPTSPRPR